MNNTGTDKRPSGFFMIDNDVVKNYELDPYEGWLYCIIVYHLNQKKNVAFPGLKTLVEETKMCRTKVIKTLKVLVEKGLIAIEQQYDPEKKSYSVNHYYVLPVVHDTHEVVHDMDQGSTPDTLGVVHDVDHNKTDLNKTKTNEPPPSEPEAQTDPTVGAGTSGDVQRGEVVTFDEMLDHLGLTQKDIDNTPATIHGFNAGDKVWVWSEKRKDHVQCTVTRETKAFVWFSFNGSGEEWRRNPDKVYHEKPKYTLFEELTPEQQIVLKWTRKAETGEGIPGETLAFANTVLKRLSERFTPTGNVPDANELDRAWAYEVGNGGIATCSPEKVPAMVKSYRTRHSTTHQVMAPATSKAPHEEAEPDCPLCKGNGILRDNGGYVDCTCRTRKRVTT